MLRWSERGAHE